MTPTVPGVATPTTPPHPTATESPTGAVAFTPSSTEASEIAHAYAQFTLYLDSGCGVQPVPRTLKAATISATEVSWAFGEMEPTPGCEITNGTGQKVPANSVGPFGGGIPEDTGVFEREPGGPWLMNDFESFPFPCPDDPDLPSESPGFDKPFVPLAVLNAVDVRYASSGCQTAFTPAAPR